MKTNDTYIKKRAIWISLSIGFLMFFGKIGAYFITGSAAILSDAMESVVHIIATSFAFYSMMLSLKPPNKSQPYGYGKIEFFSAGIEGSLIIIAALTIIALATRDIIVGPELQRIDTGILIIAAASIINFILGFYLIHTGKKTNSLILIADGKHILTDSVTSIGAIVALVLILIFDNVYIDPVFAILIAANILFTGSKLLKQSVKGLMNTNDPEIISQIESCLNKIVESDNNFLEYHRLRYWLSGDKYYIDMHATCPDDMTVMKSHDLLEKIESVLEQDVFKKNEVEVLLHIDPTSKVTGRTRLSGENT